MASAARKQRQGVEIRSGTLGAVLVEEFYIFCSDKSLCLSFVHQERRAILQDCFCHHWVGLDKGEDTHENPRGYELVVLVVLLVVLLLVVVLFLLACELIVLTCYFALYFSATGDRTEISNQLLGYGIPVDLMPLTESGNVKTKNFTHWLKVRRTLEDNHRNNKCGRGQQQHDGMSNNNFIAKNIECPGLNDVIFRSGKNHHMSHPGNVMFHGIIESKHDEHCAAHQDDKAVITWWVIEQVESKGGRFLEWNDHSMWSQIMDRNHIRSKVSSCFRTFRRKLNAFKNTSSQQQSADTYSFSSYSASTVTSNFQFIQDGNGNRNNNNNEMKKKMKKRKVSH